MFYIRRISSVQTKSGQIDANKSICLLACQSARELLRLFFQVYPIFTLLIAYHCQVYNDTALVVL